MYDPDVTLATMQQAITYLQQNAKAHLDGLGNAMKDVRKDTEKTTVADDVLNRALEAIHAPDNLVADLKATLLATARRQNPVNPTPELIGYAVRALNYAEHETITRGAVKRKVGDIKIGTEFSFGDGKPDTEPSASINIRTEIPDAPRNESQDKKREREEKFNTPRDQAKLIVAKWAKDAAAAAADIPDTPDIVVTDKKGKGDFAAKTITYNFPAKGDDPPWSWFWVADIDEGCYETQTKPTAAADFQKPVIRAIIEKHIFGLAARTTLEPAGNRGQGQRSQGRRGQAAEQPAEPRGLRPDPTVTGGGGHLSFDAGTAFGDSQGRISLELTIAALEQLQTTADDLSRRFRTGVDGKALQQDNDDRTGRENVPADFQNAPSLETQQVRGNAEAKPLAQYGVLLAEVRSRLLGGDPVGLTALHQQLVGFNRTLTNPKVAQGERKQHLEDPDNVSHYQAVNIEHLGDAAEADRRIEIRDVPAQSDYDKFLADLGHLLDELTLAKQEARLTQEARLF